MNNQCINNAENSQKFVNIRRFFDGFSAVLSIFATPILVWMLKNYSKNHKSTWNTCRVRYTSENIIFERKLTNIYWNNCLVFNEMGLKWRKFASGFCLTNCIWWPKFIFCHFGPWPIYQARRDFRFRGVIF